MHYFSQQVKTVIVNVATYQFQSAQFIFKLIYLMLFLSVYLGAFNGCSKSQPHQEENENDQATKQPAIKAQIDGASMAPRIKGSHHMAKCPDCKAEFAFDALSSIQLKKICCPFCGEQFAKDLEHKLRPRSQVKVLPLQAQARVRRWEVIAFSEQEGRKHSVKRVVGLPLEKIAIEEGDILVRGSVVTKSPQNQLDTRILVFDSDHMIKGQLEFTSGQIDFLPMQLEGSNIGINYMHRANYDSPSRRKLELVKDFYGYNQTTTRSLNLCHDLSCELRFEDIDTDQGPFQFKVTIRTLRYGIVKFEVLWTKDRITRTVHQDGARIFGTISRRDTQGVNLKVCLGIIDGQVRFLHNPKFNNSSPLIVRENPEWNGEGPQVSFSSAGKCPVKLIRLQVFRDIHYFEKIPREHQLEKNEYFVIGDNVPVSRDSRQGKRPTSNEIIGKVTQ